MALLGGVRVADVLACCSRRRPRSSSARCRPTS